jgi:PAS domain S-box-containing protein
MEDSGVVILDFRALLEAAPDGIAVVDERGRMLVVNEQLCQLFGYQEAELVGRPVEMLAPPRLREAHGGHRQGYNAAPACRPMGLGLDLVGLCKDGSELPVEISLSPLTSGGRSLTVAVVRDVSERLRLQAKQKALQSLVDIQQERYRIGMDLHDGVMQDIYAVSLGLGMAADDIDSDAAQAKEDVRNSVEQLHGIIRDIRSYIFDLRPRQFTGDLGQALQDLAREFQHNSSIQTDVHITSDLPEVEHQIGVALYVITHEALSNTRKYAQASKVTIRLFTESGSLCLEVRDDGRGFDPASEIPQSHRGLRNMASRASLVGADLSISSAPELGTAIQVELGLTSSTSSS